MSTLKKAVFSAIIISVLFSAANYAQPVQVDESLPRYKKAKGVKGTLNSIGSDTILNMMTLWAEGFKALYPDVKIQIEGKGSSTAPPALIEGTAQLGPMSRKMKSEETDKFEDKYGYSPTAISIAMDALAIYVHKDNPISKLTFEEADAIFSSTRKRGHKEDIKTWDQLGLKGGFTNKPISVFGRNSASGTYGYFKDDVLKKGDYKNIIKEQPGSASVVQGVSEDKYAIGYSGIGYKTSGVKALALAEKNGEPYYDANFENVKDGNYPLSRNLYIYVAKNPSKEMDLLVKEFLKFVLSYEGQQIVVKDGYLPLSKTEVTKQLKKIE